MAKEQSKANTGNGAANGGILAPMDGLRKANTAYSNAPDQFKITPRRRKEGPPAGMAERRKVNYSGRRDHMPELAAAPMPTPAAPTVRPTAAQAQAAAQEAAQRAQEAAELAAAAAAAADHAREAADSAAAWEAMQEKEAAERRAQEAAERAAAAQRAQEAERAAAQAAARTAQAAAAQGAPIWTGAEQRVHGGRRAGEYAYVSPEMRKHMRRVFSLLDIQLNDLNYEDIDETKFNFGSHSRAYIQIFLNCIRKRIPAIQAHNFAAKRAYGNAAQVI